MNADDDLELLASAFPTLSEQQLRECLGASRDASGVAPPVASYNTTGFFAAVARAVIGDAPSTALGTAFPGLRDLADAVVLGGAFTARCHLALRQLGNGDVYTWGDLALRSSSQLGAILQMGDRSLAQVVAVTARVSVLLLPTTGRRPASRRAERTTSTVTPTLWTEDKPQQVNGESVGSAIATSAGGITDLYKPGWTERIHELELALGDERDRAVFWASIDTHPPSHAGLAHRFGVSPERVRQLRARVEKNARLAVLGPRLMPLQQHADTLGQRLGLGFRETAPWARAAVDRSVQVVDTEWRDRAHRLLLWLAGPYRADENGWVVRGPLPDRRAALGAATEECLRVDHKKLEAELIDAGLVDEAVGDWLAEVAGLRGIDDEVYLWEGSVGDKASALLSAWKRPATVAELIDAIGEGHSERWTRGRLLSDARFKRVDRSRVGLRGWPHDEYTGTVEELARELEGRGGTCDAHELVVTVAQRFDIAVRSVRVHIRAPRFVVEGTRVRFRRADEPYQPRREITDAPFCYLLGRLDSSYRMTVDSQALRGSARWIPDGLGSWLGVLPGGKETFFDGTEDVQVFWSANSVTGPLIGSLRNIVLRLGGLPGDHLLLRFNRERHSLTAVLTTSQELSAKTPEEQVEALTGLRITGPIAEEVAAAIGVAPSALEDRLRYRGENDLLAIISAQPSFRERSS